MDIHRDIDGEALPPSEMSRIDQVVARFATALARGEKPRIEDCLAEVPEVARAVLLEQLVDHDMRHRRRIGEHVNAADYEQRYPQMHDAATADISCELVGTHTRTSTFLPGEERHGRSEETPPPETVGRYQIKRLLGKGAFGAVYLAWDPQLRRDVAIKIPRLRVDGNDKQIDQFVKEAQRAVQLERHQGIVPVYDVGRDGDLCYIVAQFINGGTLIDWVAKEHRSLPQVLHLVAKIAEIIQFAHDAGWVHRDIKPSNILIDRDGRPFLTDFGLTVRLDDLGNTEASLHGTPNYMAPELVRGALSRMKGQFGDVARHDHRVDIYSLGVVLYQLLAKHLPFDAENLHDLFDKTLSQEPPPLNDRDNAVPERLEQVCLKALAKDPDDRFQSAADLAIQLRAMAAALESHGSPTADAHRGLSRRLIVTLIASGLLLFIVAVVAYLASRPSDDANPIAPNVNSGDGQLAQLDDSMQRRSADRQLILDELKTIVAKDHREAKSLLRGEKADVNVVPLEFYSLREPQSTEMIRGGHQAPIASIPDSPQPALGSDDYDQQLFRSLVIKSQTSRTAGRYSDAEAKAQEMVALSAGNAQRQQLAFRELGLAQIELGFVAEAEQTFNFALQQAKQRSDVAGQCELLIDLAAVQMREGNSSAALASLAQAEAMLQPDSAYELQTRLFRDGILAALESADVDKATAFWQQLKLIAHEGDESSANFLDVSERLVSPGSP